MNIIYGINDNIFIRVSLTNFGRADIDLIVNGKLKKWRQTNDGKMYKPHANIYIPRKL